MFFRYYINSEVILNSNHQPHIGELVVVKALKVLTYSPISIETNLIICLLSQFNIFCFIVILFHYDETYANVRRAWSLNIKAIKRKSAWKVITYRGRDERCRPLMGYDRNCRGTKEMIEGWKRTDRTSDPMRQHTTMCNV